MSTSRGGFFSLNRLLGRKNKKDEKSATNDFQKSSMHTLTRSITNLEVISPTNQIQPITTKHKAPFEQTFRLTVYLPHGQLYVARIGAKTKLVELLDTICADKLLDANKFDFRHPADDAQIFDLDFTVGEVGLNEIKLTPKSYNASKDDAPVKYRSHASAEYRLTVRPQTMSSVSPYSSTNSLNSSDSSGVVAATNARNTMPPLPNRKKRAAPRPPSQNSIPEDREDKCATAAAAAGKPSIQAIDEDDRYEAHLVHRTFHVSSPNMTAQAGATPPPLQLPATPPASSNGATSSNCSSPDASLGSSFDGSKNTNPSSREPTVLENSGSSSAASAVKCARSESTASSSSRNHSRTSSEASDITRDAFFHDPKSKKRTLLINKKKAPAPPPRAITPTPLISNLKPVATPRSVQPSPDLSDDVGTDAEHEQSNEKAEIRTSPEDSPIELSKRPNAMPNVSKVMLNVEEPPISQTATIVHAAHSADTPTEDHKPYTFSQKITNFDEARAKSTEDLAKAGAQEPQKPKLGKKVSVVDIGQNGELTIPSNDEAEAIETPIARTRQLSDSDTEELAQQIDEILERATERNLAQTRAEGSAVADEFYNEINNNKVCMAEAQDLGYSIDCSGSDAVHVQQPKEVKTEPKSLPAASERERPAIKSVEVPSNADTKSAEMPTNAKPEAESAEVPIKPVLNETQSFDFEYSDQSLPTSTTNTMETPSTGPESLITSDIEDGYKGNDTDTMSRSQLSREEFIESQFGFLSEHMDGRAGDSDSDDKLFNKSDIISSTMINPPLHASRSTSFDAAQTPAADKSQVINELTNIINGNRLDTFIKATGDTERIDVSKRSTLPNFQISAYTNGNHKNVKVKVSPKYVAVDAARSGGRPAATAKRLSLTNGLGADASDDECDKSDAWLKPINRSVSFHATQLAMNEHTAALDAPIPASKPLSSTPRSASYVSLISLHKAEKQSSMLTLNCGLAGTRHKSSSELSIADSPTLQSIEIMKSILSGSLASMEKKAAEKKGAEKKEAEPLKEEGEPLAEVEEPTAVETVTPAEEKVAVSVEKVAARGEKVVATVAEPPKDEAPQKKLAENGVHAKAEVAATNGSAATIGSAEPKPSEPVQLRPAPEPKKTWKYQGPPAINVSTWGERPKSQVYIKSDNDYIFGGSGASKMAALQKRFSVSPNEEKPIERQRSRAAAAAAATADDQTDKRCDNGVCKLPIVRGVEYKKNVLLTNPSIEQKVRNGDAIDAAEQVVRPSYEVSRLVSDKPFADKVTGSFVALNRLSSVPAKIESKPFSATNVNGKASAAGARVNGHSENSDVNGNLVNGNGFLAKTNGNGPIKPENAVEAEKPLFAQFALRKTGLKEKILDDTAKVETEPAQPTKAIRLTAGQANGARPKSNPIPTAPKPPPPVLKKPALVRPVSMVATPVSVDSRDDLMNSIRNFKRGNLKRNCMV